MNLARRAVVLTAGLLIAGWAHEPSQAQQKPTVFIIGDSTVKTGSGEGEGGLWGWGAFLGEHFDLGRVNVENHALGGRSSRTFQTEGLWEGVLAWIPTVRYWPNIFQSRRFAPERTA